MFLFQSMLLISGEPAFPKRPMWEPGILGAASRHRSGNGMLLLPEELGLQAQFSSINVAASIILIHKCALSCFSARSPR
jgi:hypothetical protein